MKTATLHKPASVLVTLAQVDVQPRTDVPSLIMPITTSCIWSNMRLDWFKVINMRLIRVESIF